MDTEWFKDRKREARITDQQVADALGVERSVANKVVNGKVPFNARRAEAVAQLFKVTAGEVLFRAGITDHAPAQPTPINDGDAVPVTSLDLSLSMGPGTIVDDFVESEPVYMDLRLLQIITRTPSDRLRLVKGIGDSMEPTLRTGDRILVDINDRQLARINGIYWIDHLGLHGIKRLRGAAPGKIMVMSDNQYVPDFEADAKDVRIHGRVIWFGREL